MRSIFKPSLFLLPVLLLLSSCDPGCVSANQFGSETITVKANPVGDGITGSYNSAKGGQVAQWHDTGLRTNGEPISVIFSGAWTSWDETTSDAELLKLPDCKLCFKREGSKNCICQPGQQPKPEIDLNGSSATSLMTDDCTIAANQADPKKCTCQVITNPPTNYPYIIALNYQDKNGNFISPDAQKACRYSKGVGLYIGLFGTNGITQPKRLYQMYSTKEVCDYPRDKDGKCIVDGVDKTRYYFESPNGMIFMKDDKAATTATINPNDGSDTNPNDDEYHKAKEVVKVIIYDQYYSDNYGYYNLDFIGGVVRSKESGILELIVDAFEDVVLGKVIDGSNQREGGAIEFLYNAIVKDTAFALVIKTSLILYVTIAGFGILAGTVQISRKEISMRLMKLALVLLFITPTSWEMYDRFFIGFFKEGMDSVLSMIMSLTDQQYQNTQLVISQMGRDSDYSQGSRFAYADLMIKKYFSSEVTKKIWSLFFGVWFGPVYIVAIYFLIAFFLFVVLTAALTYITSVLKLVFVIAIGPLFLLASLFNQTSGMFKKWITFMATRSLEIIMVFTVLYFFLILIDLNFTKLLAIDACTKSFSLGLFNLNLLLGDVKDRNFITWISMIINLGLLTFLMHMIVAKVPGLANAVVSTSGVAMGNSTSKSFNDANTSAFGLANSLMSDAISIGKRAISTAAPIALRGAITAGKMSGLGKLSTAIGERIPFRGPRSRMRDFVIDRAINNGRKEGMAKGLQGADLDKFARQSASNALHSQAYSQPTKFAMLGIDADAIDKRMEQKLVREPLQKFLKEEAKKQKQMKGDKMLFGRDMKDHLRESARKWAENNLVGGSQAVESHLRDLKGFMKKEGELSSSEAAKKFAGNAEAENKYLAHLQSRQFKQEVKNQSRTGSLDKFKGRIQSGVAAITRSTALNPKMAEQNYLRKAQYQRSKEALLDQSRNATGFKGKAMATLAEGAAKVGINPAKGLNPMRRINVLDRLANRQALRAAKKGGYQAKLFRSDAQDLGKQAGENAKRFAVNYLTEGYKKDLDRAAANRKMETENRLSNKNAALTQADIERRADRANNLAGMKRDEALRLWRSDEEVAKNMDALRNENGAYKEEKDKIEKYYKEKESYLKGKKKFGELPGNEGLVDPKEMERDLANLEQDKAKANSLADKRNEDAKKRMANWKIDDKERALMDREMEKEKKLLEASDYLTRGHKKEMEDIDKHFEARANHYANLPGNEGLINPDDIKSMRESAENRANMRKDQFEEYMKKTLEEDPKALEAAKERDQALPDSIKDIEKELMELADENGKKNREEWVKDMQDKLNDKDSSPSEAKSSVGGSSDSYLQAELDQMIQKENNLEDQMKITENRIAQLEAKAELTNEDRNMLDKLKSELNSSSHRLGFMKAQQKSISDKIRDVAKS